MQTIYVNGPEDIRGKSTTSRFRVLFLHQPTTPKINNNNNDTNIPKLGLATSRIPSMDMQQRSTTHLSTANIKPKSTSQYRFPFHPHVPYRRTRGAALRSPFHFYHPDPPSYSLPYTNTIIYKSKSLPLCPFPFAPEIPPAVR